jgi:hypothetical protein
MLRARVTFRYSLSGGALLPDHEATEAAHAPKARLILLVHGYNVSRPEAEPVYDDFARRMHALSPFIADDFCAVYWPGDTSVPIIRGAWYPWRIAQARGCAPLLLDFLEARRSGTECPVHFVIIAHSLGCRFVLETLKLFSEQPDRRSFQIDVILMAAAVPEHLLRSGGVLQGARQGCGSARVLYSQADRILRFAFPIGQWVAGEPGVAVGRNGEPTGYWNEVRQMHGYDHGDYWRLWEITWLIARWLGLSVMPPPTARSVWSRSIAPAHELADPISLPSTPDVVHRLAH